MGVIKGYPLERQAKQQVEASADAQWLGAQVEDDRIMLYVEETDESEREAFEVVTIGTGYHVEEHLEYVDTVVYRGNAVHVYVDDN